MRECGGRSGARLIDQFARHRCRHPLNFKIKNPGDHGKSSGSKSYSANSSLGNYAVSCSPFLERSSLKPNLR